MIMCQSKTATGVPCQLDRDHDGYHRNLKHLVAWIDAIPAEAAKRLGQKAERTTEEGDR